MENVKKAYFKCKDGLDQKYLDQARKIQAYQIGYFYVNIEFDQKEIHILHHEELLHRIPLKTFYKQPSHVFKVIKETVFI